jgi:hypothetical protein
VPRHVERAVVNETSPTPPRFSPLPPDAPTKDRIHTAVLAMACGTCAGVTWFGILTLIQTRLLRGSTARAITQIDPHSFDANFMAYGIPMGLAFGAIVAWSMMFAIPSSYRRGGLSLVAAFAGTVVGLVLTYVGRALGGATTLAAITVVFFLVTLWLGRRTLLSAAE